MAKKTKDWIVESVDKKLGNLPESSHSSLTKVLASFPKRLSGVTHFIVKAGNRTWQVHKENTK